MIVQNLNIYTQKKSGEADKNFKKKKKFVSFYEKTPKPLHAYRLSGRRVYYNYTHFASRCQPRGAFFMLLPTTSRSDISSYWRVKQRQQHIEFFPPANISSRAERGISTKCLTHFRIQSVDIRLQRSICALRSIYCNRNFFRLQFDMCFAREGARPYTHQ